MKVFSFDAETNGLWGQAFAVSAAVYENGKLVADFTAYLGPDGVTDGWVRENVLPNLNDLVQTHSSYDDMLADFAKFYLDNKSDADVIIHMGVPVESKVIIDMHSRGFIGDRDGPYPLIDIAGNLQQAGENPTSVDEYAKKYGVAVDPAKFVGGTHNPLFDSAQAAAVYHHLIG